MLPPVHCLETVQLSRPRCIEQHLCGFHVVVLITDVDCGAHQNPGEPRSRFGGWEANEPLNRTPFMCNLDTVYFITSLLTQDFKEKKLYSLRAIAQVKVN